MPPFGQVFRHQSHRRLCFQDQLTPETRGETGDGIPKSNSQDLFQQLDLTTGAKYNQYLIMFNCGNSDGDVALYHEFCPGGSARSIVGFQSFFENNFLKIGYCLQILIVIKRNAPESLT